MKKKQLSIALSIICILTFWVVFVQASEPPSGSTGDNIEKILYYNLQKLPKDLRVIADPSYIPFQSDRFARATVFVDSTTCQIIGFANEYSIVPLSSLPRPPKNACEFGLQQDLLTGKIMVAYATGPFGPPEASKLNALLETFEGDLIIYNARAEPLLSQLSSESITRLPNVAPVSSAEKPEGIVPTPSGGVQGSAGHLDSPPTSVPASETAAQTPKGPGGFLGKFKGFFGKVGRGVKGIKGWFSSGSSGNAGTGASLGMIPGGVGLLGMIPGPVGKAANTVSGFNFWKYLEEHPAEVQVGRIWGDLVGAGDYLKQTPALLGNPNPPALPEKPDPNTKELRELLPSPL